MRRCQTKKAYRTIEISVDGDTSFMFTFTSLSLIVLSLFIALHAMLPANQGREIKRLNLARQALLGLTDTIPFSSDAAPERRQEAERLNFSWNSSGRHVVLRRELEGIFVEEELSPRTAERFRMFFRTLSVNSEKLKINLTEVESDQLNCIDVLGAHLGALRRLLADSGVDASSAQVSGVCGSKSGIQIEFDEL